MTSEPSGKRSHQGRIAGFDGLRAIAFLLVFLSHKAKLPHHDSYGDAGVYLFFVLSGFLITRILVRSRDEIEGRGQTFPGALAQFYARRTARIFPIYYLVLTFWILVALWVVVPDFGWKDRLAHFTYTTNILVAHRNQWIGDFGHFWTLAVEEQFYILFAPVVLLTPRSRSWVVATGFLLTGVATKMLLEAVHAPPISIDMNSFVNFALLALGGLAGLFARNPAPQWLQSGTAQAISLLFFVALPIATGGSAGWPLWGKAIGVVAAMLLVEIFQGQQSWLVAMLERAPLRLTGRISYGAYLFHPFIHFPFAADAARSLGLNADIATFIRIGGELVATLALASLSWVFLERPIVNWAKRRY